MFVNGTRKIKGLKVKVIEEASQSQLWNLLDLLRSEIPPQEISSAVAALIYLRWADFQEAEQEAISEFDETEFYPVLPASFHWRSWYNLPAKDLKSFFTIELQSKLSNLNNNRHSALATNLHRVSSAIEKLGRLSPQNLQLLVSWLADQPFETPNDRRQLLNSFDSILTETSNRSAGEYRTPLSVIKMIIELAAPAAGDRIYDPCFGTAGFLTGAYEHVLNMNSEKFSSMQNPPLSIFGVELSIDAYVVGLTRLVLAGIEDPKIELGNSLERMPPDNPISYGYDLVMMNPPWGMRVPAERLFRYPIKTTDATGVFIQHAISCLKPNGRAVIVVPESFLFRGGQEKYLRKYLLDHHNVESVISLPPGTFNPSSGIKASILVIRRGSATKEIRMIDSKAFSGEQSGKNLLTEVAEIATVVLAGAAIGALLGLAIGEIADFIKERKKKKSTSKKEKSEEIVATQIFENSWEVSPETLTDTDWDLSVRRRDQSGLFDIFETLKGKIEITTLNECCDVFSGRVIKSSDLSDTPKGEKRIPYIRIKDIQQGQVVKGSSWLVPDVIDQIDAKSKLRLGDVLLSRSGTIGKVGIVRNGAVNGIAVNGLYILRPDVNRIDPHFLLAYLESNECRSWLNANARGAAIQHLSKRFLDELPVPIPPISVQRQISLQFREKKIDALLFLTQLFRSGRVNPIIEWVDNNLRTLSERDDLDEDSNDLEIFDQMASGFALIRNRIAHDSVETEDSLALWALDFYKTISKLRGIANIPVGPGLFSILQEVSRNLSHTSRTLTGDIPDEIKALNLTDEIVNRLNVRSTAFLKNVELIITTLKSKLQAGEITEISFSIHNKGSLPLRDLEIRTTPDWGSIALGYIPEGGKKEFNLTIDVLKNPGEISLVLNWTAIRLDGSKTDGKREIVFEIHEQSETDNKTKIELTGSPYVCGDPVRPERDDVFFGREHLLDQIRRQVIRSGNVILLEGNRRAGKSSILCHLEGLDAVPGWLGIYCSLQGAEGSRSGLGVPTEEVFREIAKSIAQSIRILGGETPLPDGTRLLLGERLGVAKSCRKGISKESPFTDFREYFELVYEILDKKNLGIILMLDEFDKLQEGIDSGVTSPQLPENIRFLVHHYSHFSAILTGSRRLKRLREEYWSALFGLGTRFGVSSLNEQDARRLIIEPVKDRLVYSKESIDLIFRLTAGQPYIIQCLCSRVFDKCADLKTRSVTLDLVQMAAATLIEDNEHFASLWDYAGSDRKRFILFLCQKYVENSSGLRFGNIQELLISNGVEIDDETLISELEYLRELELIDLKGDSTVGLYSLTIPLMGNWISKQHDFVVIKGKARIETEEQHD